MSTVKAAARDEMSLFIPPPFCSDGELHCLFSGVAAGCVVAALLLLGARRVLAADNEGPEIGAAVALVTNSSNNLVPVLFKASGMCNPQD